MLGEYTELVREAEAERKTTKVDEELLVSTRVPVKGNSYKTYSKDPSPRPSNAKKTLRRTIVGDSKSSLKHETFLV